ncbi:hypothetical protein [Desulfatibacillum aliphaticivorans]|uniref:hypothetical protein n=1 Tax=Desulfatibacillum aliphaticivorans TaxID=218208 RepID=UPI000410286C|nr:hypothetical protein [Desulfatibacillum aliphaticivorans]
MNDNGSTKEPGIEISSQEAKPIVEAFLAKFKSKDVNIPSNLPTACQLKGIKDIDVLRSSKFLNLNKIYYYFDFSNQLFETLPKEILEFYDSLQPWEDYDFCIFDSGMKWCIGVTHNDDVILVDPERILNFPSPGLLENDGKNIKKPAD